MANAKVTKMDNSVQGQFMEAQSILGPRKPWEKERESKKVSTFKIDSGVPGVSERLGYLAEKVSFINSSLFTFLEEHEVACGYTSGLYWALDDLSGEAIGLAELLDELSDESTIEKTLEALDGKLRELREGMWENVEDTLSDISDLTEKASKAMEEQNNRYNDLVFVGEEFRKHYSK